MGEVSKRLKRVLEKIPDKKVRDYLAKVSLAYDKLPDSRKPLVERIGGEITEVTKREPLDTKEGIAVKILRNIMRGIFPLYSASYAEDLIDVAKKTGNIEEAKVIADYLMTHLEHLDKIQTLTFEAYAELAGMKPWGNVYRKNGYVYVPYLDFDKEVAYITKRSGRWEIHMAGQIPFSLDSAMAAVIAAGRDLENADELSRLVYGGLCRHERLHREKKSFVCDVSNFPYDVFGADSMTVETEVNSPVMTLHFGDEEKRITTLLDIYNKLVDDPKLFKTAENIVDDFRIEKESVEELKVARYYLASVISGRKSEDGKINAGNLLSSLLIQKLTGYNHDFEGVIVEGVKRNLDSELGKELAEKYAKGKEDEFIGLFNWVLDLHPPELVDDKTGTVSDVLRGAMKVYDWFKDIGKNFALNLPVMKDSEMSGELVKGKDSIPVPVSVSGEEKEKEEEAEAEGKGSTESESKPSKGKDDAEVVKGKGEASSRKGEQLLPSSGYAPGSENYTVKYLQGKSTVVSYPGSIIIPDDMEEEEWVESRKGRIDGRRLPAFIKGSVSGRHVDFRQLPEEDPQDTILFGLMIDMSGSMGDEQRGNLATALEASAKLWEITQSNRDELRGWLFSSDGYVVISEAGISREGKNIVMKFDKAGYGTPEWQSYTELIKLMRSIKYGAVHSSNYSFVARNFSNRTFSQMVAVMVSDFWFGYDVSDMRAAIDAANYSGIVQIGIPVSNPDQAIELFGKERVIDATSTSDLLTPLKKIYDILKLFKKQ